MIRPQARETLWRWRGVAAAVAVIAVGVWWGLASFGIVQWVGWALAGAGVGFAISAWQRLRFYTGEDGPGVVTIAERRVTYLGPHDGGVADLDLLAELKIVKGPPIAWRLTAESGAVIDIPLDALGAEKLFDIFASLPGLGPEQLIRARAAPSASGEALWTAPTERLDTDSKRPTFH